MVTINTNYRPDDLGTRALERENTGPKETKAVSATAPKPAIAGTEARPEPESPPPGVQPRQHERRKGRDRRQRDIPVLLDTRNNRERRRNPEKVDADEPPVRGIDVFT
ncbi:hypothetical protein [Thiohalobacter thiocyanaticus]|uniref:Uncharacterized protein n=1 Tax=Thiohalobacter thiocyanaticus TaxID=585455 RepID=A0A426QIC1_9GAMM|nr:hypothetical protein [Thiohalobacter thiocyanaticus]RRQ21490.1 hypothetical protein D6C00_05735 [Thiohalobacter thiocyanaticus]